MKPAEIIAVGSELLAGAVDTNGPWLAEQLALLGVEVTRTTVVGDHRKAIGYAILESLKRADLVIMTGGLGPTGDDVTREAVAEALKRPLHLNEAILKKIREAFAAHHLVMPENNRVQALVPKGAVVLPNSRGTAPGLVLRQGRRMLVVLPGPPAELQPMVLHQVLPILKKQKPSRQVIRVKVLKVWGAPESVVDEKLRDLFAQSNPVLALLASQSEIKVKLTAQGPSGKTVSGLLARAEKEIRLRLGSWVFGADEDTMESVVGRLLAQKKFTLAVAESCTGGLIGHKLTSVPGSSAYFERGVVTYSNQAKTDLLKVPKALIARHGAVSSQVAEAMAKNIRRLARTTFGLSVTGIAGPTGATSAKPVGLVYMALASPQKIRVEKFHFRGTRDFVKERAAQAALNLIRLSL